VRPLRAGEVTIVARDLTVRLGGSNALEDVSFEIPAGATVALLGPNGAGKTTLFRAAVGLVKPQRGSIDLGSGSVAFVPQRLDIEPSFPVTVTDVVRMGRYPHAGWIGRFSAEDHALVADSIEALGISPLSGRRFGDLSGGERQRTLLAQARAQRSEVLLLDEPFAGLDAPTRSTLLGELARWRSEGRTIVVATHDLESASRDYDFVLALNRRLIAFGPAETTCTEEVLERTFAGHVIKVGSLLVDVEHHHHDAG
jgi:ABC-type Mn2+/Zn2+ transport system ATPase subunit